MQYYFSNQTILVHVFLFPQEEVIRQPPNVMAPEQVQYYFQLSQLQQQSGATASQPATASTPQITQLPPGAQIIQQPNGQIVIAAQAHQIAALTGNATNVCMVLFYDMHDL